MENWRCLNFQNVYNFRKSTLIESVWNCGWIFYKLCRDAIWPIWRHSKMILMPLDFGTAVAAVVHFLFNDMYKCLCLWCAVCAQRGSPLFVIYIYMHERARAWWVPRVHFIWWSVCSWGFILFTLSLSVSLTTSFLMTVIWFSFDKPLWMQCNAYTKHT